MDDNPWIYLPDGPPYVLPDDAPAVNAFNAQLGPWHDHFLHTDQILPEPFVGPRYAPVVLLSNNPGFTEQDVPWKQDPDFITRMRYNQLHGDSPYPFVYLDPAVNGHPVQWWAPRLRHLVDEFTPEVVARSILNIVYLPYPSRRYGHNQLQLTSQGYSFRLVEDAMERGAAIVFMRQPDKWIHSVPELALYSRRYVVNNTQNPTISPNNCPGYQDVVEAIAATI